MLRSLHMKDVGPAPSFDLELGERLNVLTGDNGLGKSFVLDVAWWALTGTWVGRPVLPRAGRETEAEIAGEFMPSPHGPESFTSRFVQARGDWDDDFRPRTEAITLRTPGVRVPVWLPEQVPVLYVRTDGGFSVWDPARNYHVSSIEPSRSVLLPEAYHFGTKELGDGLAAQDRTICNGLIQDWTVWQIEANATGSYPFQLLSRVLSRLSYPAEEMKPGKPVRLYADEVRKFPTVELPYETVPVIRASAGMRRIISLSYLIAWAWTEHVEAAGLLGWKPSERIVVLMEEPETHLHARWQRHIVPALVDVLRGLSPVMKPQLFLTTHSPLVLESLEPQFNQAIDKLFMFELRGREVSLRDLPWGKREFAISWMPPPLITGR